MTEENVPDGEPNVSMSETERPPSGNGHADNESAALSNELLASGRGMLGVVARFEYGPVGEALNASRSGIRTALILGLVAGLNTLTVVLWTVLSRQIGVSLGVGSLARMPVATLVAAMSIAVPVLSLPRADLRRQRVTLGSAFATSSLLCLAVAGTFWGLLVAAVLAGAGLAVTHAVHFELMLDTYRPEVRVRMFSVYGCVLLACTAAGLLVLSLSGTAHGISWRFALLVLAACGAALTCLSPLVANPEHGRWDRHRIEEMVHVANGGVGTRSTGLAKDSTGIAAGERIRRVLVIRSSREAFLGGSISGLLLVPIPMYSQILWRDRFNVHPSGMAPLLAILFLAGGLGPIWLYRRGEVAFRRSPAGVAKLAGWAGAVSGVALSAAGAGPSLGLTVFALAVATSGLAALLVGTLTLLIPVVDFEYRSQASLIHGVAAVSGAVVGTQIMSAVGARFGAQWPFVIIGLVVVCSSARVTKMGATLEADLDRIVSRAIDASELDVAISKGRKPALLDCRHIDFSYGQLQVLFDVNFSVDEGEMVALLGTNGAGKSTLLRAISGVGFVDRGTLHYRGSEVTYLPYDRRVKLGIVQIPGGRAVFGPLTVVENLRAFGFALGADRKVIEKGIEESLATFPRLAERRNQLASTLSGGEQQMLGLAKAIILKPRLLLIDELSLGLAPRIVGELLEMVRRINQSGTAVVLVEQSVNIALSLVDHAYFMEKGEIRFDGSASALLARPDLLRAVFLQGAAKGAL